MNLGEIQQKLNEDEKIRNEFMENPVAVLRKEGLELTSEMEKTLEELVSQATKPQQDVPGASIQTAGRRDHAIMISISKDF